MGIFIIAVNLVILSLCLVIGTLQIILYLSSNHTNVLIAGISSLLLCGFKLVQLALHMFSIDIKIWELLLQVVLGLLYLAFGITININFINQSVIPDTIYHLLISTLFIISLLFITTSFIIHINHYYQNSLQLDSDSEKTLYNNQKSSSYNNPPNHINPHFQPQTFNSVMKKISDRTLVDNPHDSAGDIDIASLIKNSISKHHDENYIFQSALTDNWMSSSLQFNNLKHAYSMPILKELETQQLRRETILIDRESLDTNRQLDDKQLDYRQTLDYKLPLGYKQSLETKQHIPIDDSENYTPLDSKQSTTPTRKKTESVKRSKSTSCIGDPLTKLKKREERWKSIHDEKIFLSTVNESLLPSVLKSGESPIMELKRKQSIIPDDQTSPTMDKRKGSKPDLLYELSASISNKQIIHQDFSSPTNYRKHSNPQIDQIDFEHDSDVSDEENLPHIYEFEEPIDQSNFDEFDQGFTDNQMSPITKREKKVYNIINGNIGKHSIPNLSHKVNYKEDLVGLESMPKSLTHRNFTWNSVDDQAGVRNISLNEWNSNSQLYDQKRSISGSNLILGLSTTNSNYNKDDYIMPITHIDARHENIDNLSDIQSELSNFKFDGISSAPSLHTFRQASDSSKTSSTKFSETSGMKLNLNTIEVNQIFHNENSNIGEYQNINTPKSSPIKKFFQESPRRISSVLKRKTISTKGSIDENHFNLELLNTKRHKHSNSVISNQISIASGVSSRSTSPRKSLKSLVMNSRSNHKKSLSVPCATFASTLSLSTPLAIESQNAWEVDTAPSSDQSRVSSVPSAVIGEYDREKWRTLQALQNNEMVSVSVAFND